MSLLFNAEVTVGFEQAVYTVTEEEGLVNLTLEISVLGGGVLECEVDVMLLFYDGPKAGNLESPCFLSLSSRCTFMFVFVAPALLAAILPN